jgi:RNA polymerase sigma-70 factor (ECF subfamily)
MAISESQIQLIHRAAAGDVAAMELFLLSQRRHLMRYLDRRVPAELRRLIEPQDVMQDVYLDVFRNMNTFTSTDPGMAMRWLVRIARNRVIDLVRMQQSSKRSDGLQGTLTGGPNETVTEESIVQLLQNLAVHEKTPSRSAAAHELSAMLERCLTKLPKEHRMAIRYRYLEGLPLDTVAHRMKRTSGAVLMLCHRGLKMLRMDLRSFSRYG